MSARHRLRTREATFNGAVYVCRCSRWKRFWRIVTFR